MNFSKTFSILFVCFGFLLYAQSEEKPNMLVDEYGKEYYYDAKLRAKVYEIEGEKVMIFDELEIQAKPRFNNQLDRNYYYFINKRLDRVYPLFLIALEQYRNLQEEIKTLNNKEKRKYIKAKQDALAQQYEKQLRDLTTTEGRIFAKLMNRATGKTVFEIIKELRGGVSAFFWNVKGNIADVELKKEYNPRKYRDDEYLEALLKSNWGIGHLKPYKGHENFVVK